MVFVPHLVYIPIVITKPPGPSFTFVTYSYSFVIPISCVPIAFIKSMVEPTRYTPMLPIEVIQAIMIPYPKGMSVGVFAASKYVRIFK